ncbi:Lissencephaly-1-like protein [Bienertia sinuspersici]
MALSGTLDPKISLSHLPKTSINNYWGTKPRTQFFCRCPSSNSMIMAVKCSSNSENLQNSGVNGNGNMKNALSNIVDKRVEELLQKEENKDMLDKLNKASERVELAKKQLADIERQELEAQQMRKYIDELEAKASEIAECEKEVMEAKAMVEEAERSLSSSKITRDDERWESVKAASISAVVGTLAAAPIYLAKVTSSPELVLQLGVTFASCALFGVTFRYAVRRDLDDSHLKTGLATLSGGSPLEFNSASFVSHAVDGGLFVLQDLLIFTFAAVSLDFCFKTRSVSPFPIDKDQI